MSQSAIKVLVVDDEAGVRDSVAELLRLEGYDVHTASDGQQALEAYGTFGPTLVVSDVLMPRMNGLELARSLRRKYPGFKLLFMSGFFGSPSINQDMMSELGRLGCPMLSKPFRAAEMLALVRQALD